LAIGGNSYFCGNFLMAFVKGQSGNPNGRKPQGKAWADVIRKVLRETVIIDGTEMEKREAIVRKLVIEAAKGESWAINALMDRTDGKPKQVIDQTNRTVAVNIDGKDADAVL